MTAEEARARYREIFRSEPKPRAGEAEEDFDWRLGEWWDEHGGEIGKLLRAAPDLHNWVPDDGQRLGRSP